MHQLRRKAAAVTSAALLLAASSMLAFPGSASAETKTVGCGSEVTAKPGDEIVGTVTKGIPLVGSKLLKFDLGAVEASTDVLTGTVSALTNIPGWLLSKLSGVVCKVTVKVADTAVKPVPGVGEQAAKSLKDTAEGANKNAQGTARTLNGLTSSSSGDESQGPDGDSSTSPDDSDGSNSAGSEPDGDSDEAPPAIAGPESHATGGGVPLRPAFLPPKFSSGYAPMRDYSDVPFAQAGLFAPAPGVRYGNGVVGYQPEFDVLGSEDTKAPKASQTSPVPQLPDKVAKAGKAEALPSAPSDGANPASVPVLLAVVVLAGSTAALVRTWVLRKA